MSQHPLESLVIENFRSVAGRWEIPLDAPIVLIHGPNGSGKTSILSAVELAATGNIGFLNEQSDGIQNVLLNRKFDSGKVRLNFRHQDNSVSIGNFSIEHRGIQGQAALYGDHRHQFLERCYLPQTALGRLLESYTATGKDVDSALVSFVKSIVGLDELDSLISGLDAAGHISRAKKASRWWTQFEDDLARAQARHAELVSEIQAAQDLLDDASNAVNSISGETHDPFDEEFLLSILQYSDGDDIHRRHYEELRIRLEGISNAYSQAAEDSPETNYQAQTQLVSELSGRLSAWQSSAGRAALSTVNKIRSEIFSQREVDKDELLDVFEDCRARLAQESNRRSEERSRISEAELSRKKLSDSLVEIENRLSVVDSAIASIRVPDDTQILLEVLKRTVQLVHSDSCPVCDQTYDSSDVSLTQHLVSKIDRLSVGTQEAAKLHDQRKNLLTEIEALRTRMDSTVVTTEVPASLDSLQEELESYREQIAEGRKLFDKLEQAESRKAKFASLISTQDAAKRSLLQIRGELDISDPISTIADEIRRLFSVVTQRSNDARQREARQKKLAEAAKRALLHHKEIRELTASLSEQMVKISRLENAIVEATRRKTAASQLRAESERVRSSVINGVFDDALNSLWADLFNRFVPQEQFVPRFKKQHRATRSVDIHLETVLPNGESSGTPSSILSYGNTNTAALSLFIALNLAAQPDPSCLIFDDPVQSMDDVHISNFATVVRELAYRHGRQVVIAVHQRELFDYLTLELAPSIENESLLKVCLNRTRDETTIETERLEHMPELPLASSNTI